MTAGVGVGLRVASRPELAARLAGPRGWPVIPTAAGHDAGILSAAGIPTAMLFVRNPTGVSHSPLETASMDDCLAGVVGPGRRPRRAGRGPGVTAYLLERAWVDGAVHDEVYVEIEGGRFTAVELVGRFPALVRRRFSADKRQDSPARPGKPTRLPGLTIPGLANCHSHAFHRALRGRTQRERGTFWTWREQMYAVAERLDPDSYLALATSHLPRDGRVGHHQRGGVPLPAPPARRDAVRRPQRHGPRAAAGGPATPA